ncbi:MAG: hypothetical protein SH817_06880, partial [Leptospira sp.]|nr:hypothetical protein [Leptospira sp.]
MKGFELILKSKKMILREYWWSFIAFWLVWIAFIGVDAFIALKFSSALIQLSLNVVIDGIVGLLVLRFCLWLLKTLGYKHLGKRTVIIIFFVAIAGGICNGILYMSSAKLVTSMHLFSEDNNKSFLNWGDKYNFFIDTNEKGRLEDWRRNFPEGFFSVFSFILFYYLLEYRRKSNQLEQNQSRLERELSF